MIQNILVASSLLLNLLALACGPVFVDVAQPAVTQSVDTIEEKDEETEVKKTETVNSDVLAKEDTTAENIGKWKRFEVLYENPSWSGNPFDLELTAVFTHVPSGRSLTQLGFYAGDNTWKIYFMPDELGEWTFTTSSPDNELDGKSGSFTCVSSDLPGRLIADGNRWKLEDSGEHVAPVLLPTREWFKRTETLNGIDDFILWAKNTTGALVIGTTLVYFTQAQDEVPYIKGEEGITFNIEMWDRLNSHYDMLRDQGMGFYIMFYSDDKESPNSNGIGPQSAEELRLFRYAIARFSAYPIVMWDTGIDIGETRGDDWIDWFATWFNAQDPWQHFVSSRSGGGSGGIIPDAATYYSDGTSNLPPHVFVVDLWSNLSIPLAFTDRWRENYTRGNFDRAKIRRAAWEVGLVGGSAVYLGGNDTDGYLSESYATDLEAAADLGHRNRFFRDNIIDLSKLAPHDEMISSGNGVVLSADPLHEYVAYIQSGGSFSIDLSNVNGSFTAAWYNPRTGVLNSAGLAEGGGVVSFSTPDNQDWVLHLTSGSASFGSCSIGPVAAKNVVDGQPENLQTIAQAAYLVFLPTSWRCNN
jgi:hypothetical protein